MPCLCSRLFNLLAISPGLVLVFFHIQWKSVGLFLLGAVPLGITGAFSSVTLPQDWVTRCIGTAILVFVLLRNRGVLDLTSKPYLMVAGGGLVGFLSGMIGSAGPMGAAIFLSLGLTPAAYIASEGMTALVMHGVKIAVYQQFIALDKDLWLLAALMAVTVMMGTWTAKRVAVYISRTTFERWISVLLIIIALYMIFKGL